MGIGPSLPKIKKPKLSLKRKGKKGGAKKGGKKGSRRGRSRYEEEEYMNWAVMMSPAAYEAVGTRPGIPDRLVSKYEDEEGFEDEEFKRRCRPGRYYSRRLGRCRRRRRSSGYAEDEEGFEDEDYEEEDYGEGSSVQQQYTPADFANVATPVNFSVVLLVLLLVLLMISRN